MRNVATERNFRDQKNEIKKILLENWKSSRKIFKIDLICQESPLENTFKNNLPGISPENFVWNNLPEISSEIISLKSPQKISFEIISQESP